METEYRGSLRRGFPSRSPEEYIVMDGWSNQYIRECTNWARAQGYIRFDRDTSDELSDSQCTALAYRLTDAGRKFLEG